MADKTPDRKEAKDAFNADTISKMTYAEIIKHNREAHKGTIMDRTWRDNTEGQEKMLNDPSMSRWKKFTSGAYSYQAVSTNWTNKFERNQVKVRFVEDLIERKDEFKTEEDKLLLKRTEIAVMRKYNSYRVPFCAASMTIMLLAATNTKRGLVFRFLPAILFMPFISIYNHNIGMYGVHK